MTAGTRPRLGLHWWSIATLLAGTAFGMLLAAVRLRNAGTPRLVGGLMGTAVGSILFPLIIGGIVYLISRRSHLAASIAVVVVVALATLGEVSHTLQGMFGHAPAQSGLGRG